MGFQQGSRSDILEWPSELEFDWFSDLVFITPIAAFLAEHEKAAVVISPAITTSYPPRREPRRHPPSSSSIPFFFLGPQSIFLFLHHRFIISAITDVPGSQPAQPMNTNSSPPPPLSSSPSLCDANDGDSRLLRAPLSRKAVIGRGRSHPRVERRQAGRKGRRCNDDGWVE